MVKRLNEIEEMKVTKEQPIIEFVLGFLFGILFSSKDSNPSPFEHVDVLCYLAMLFLGSAARAAYTYDGFEKVGRLRHYTRKEKRAFFMGCASAFLAGMLMVFEFLPILFGNSTRLTLYIRNFWH